MNYALTFLLFIVAVISVPPAYADDTDRYDPDRAIELSQAAIGRVIGDYEFIDRNGANVRLRRDHAGRPFVISMIFTSCHHVCPATTKHLDTAIASAREALGDDSFDVVTIGFDVANDTPQAMAAFARRQGYRPNRLAIFECNTGYDQSHQRRSRLRFFSHATRI